MAIAVLVAHGNRGCSRRPLMAVRRPGRVPSAPAARGWSAWQALVCRMMGGRGCGGPADLHHSRRRLIGERQQQPPGPPTTVASNISFSLSQKNQYSSAASTTQQRVQGRARQGSSVCRRHTASQLPLILRVPPALAFQSLQRRFDRFGRFG